MRADMFVCPFCVRGFCGSKQDVETQIDIGSCVFK